MNSGALPCRIDPEDRCQPPQVDGLERTAVLFDFRTTVRTFIERELDPHLDQWERGERVPLHKVVAALHSAGLMGLRLDPGADGDGLWRHVVLVEELGRLRAAAMGLSVLVHADMVLGMLSRHGSPQAKERFLGAGLRGEAVYGRSLPVGAQNVSMSAERHGDAYLVGGEARTVVNGAVADAHCVVAMLQPPGGPPEPIVLMVSTELRGVEVDRTRSRDGTGLAAVAATLRCRDVSVPAWCRLGPAGGDFAWDATVAQEHVLAACRATAAADDFVEATFEYSRARRSFGTPLYDHQAVRLRLAELRMQVEGSRRLNHAAVGVWVGGGDFRLPSAVAIFKAARLVYRAAEDCLVLHGAAGYMEEHPAARFIREADLLAATHGSDDVLLSTLVRLGGLDG